MFPKRLLQQVPGSFALPSCSSLDSAGLEGIVFCPSAGLPGETISKTKLLLETALLFLSPKGLGCVSGGGELEHI